MTGLSLGSIAGGLMCAQLGWPRQTAHAVTLLGVHATALLLTAATDHTGALVLLVVAGIPVAALNSLAALLIDRRVPRFVAGESMTVATTALVVGTGIGQATTARLIGIVSPEGLVMLAAVPPALLALALAAQRSVAR